MDSEKLTLYRTREVEGVLDPAVVRALTAMPAMPSPSCLVRPAVLIVGPTCSALLSLAASCPSIATIAVVESASSVDSEPLDSRIDDVVTPHADLDELLMRGRRALARKRTLAEGPSLPQVNVEGVRWRDVSVPLSSTEARIAERLLRTPGIVVSDIDLRALDESGIPMTRRALDTHIYRLRKKLEPIDCITIRSVRQRGFRADVLPLH